MVSLTRHLPLTPSRQTQTTTGNISTIPPNNDNQQEMWAHSSSITDNTPTMDDPSNANPSKPNLKSIIAEAATFGCYVPVIMNGKASVWHYDSGAALTQAHPDTLREMIPGIVQADEDGATFASAEAKSKVDLSLWFIKEVALLQIESGITTITVSGYAVGNPKVRKGTLLLGLNLQRPLIRRTKIWSSMGRVDPSGSSLSHTGTPFNNR